MFPNVHSSATSLTAACHCIRPCGGQAVANSALGSKSLATPGIEVVSNHNTKHFDELVDLALTDIDIRVGQCKNRDFVINHKVFSSCRTMYFLQKKQPFLPHNIVLHIACIPRSPVQHPHMKAAAIGNAQPLNTYCSMQYAPN